MLTKELEYDEVEENLMLVISKLADLQIDPIKMQLRVTKFGGCS